MMYKKVKDFRIKERTIYTIFILFEPFLSISYTTLMQWMGLMKRYQFPNVWAKVISIVNKRMTPSEGPTSGAPQGAVQPSLGTTDLDHTASNGSMTDE
jgi:hypothetical protein